MPKNIKVEDGLATNLTKLKELLGLGSSPIHMEDILSIDETMIETQQITEPKQMAQYMFHNILMLNYEARDLTLENNQSKDQRVAETLDSFLCEEETKKDSSDTENELHTLDVLYTLIYSSDMFVQQYFVTKLAQCQLALPFLLFDPSSLCPVFPLWMLRPITKAWCTKNDIGQNKSDQQIISADTKIVSFVRLGGLDISKSSVLNRIVSKYGHDIFCHRDSKGSRGESVLANGIAECCWYLPKGSDDDTFKDMITFVNLRGDAETLDQQMKFLYSVSNMLVIFTSQANTKQQQYKKKLEEWLALPIQKACIFVDKEQTIQQYQKECQMIGIKGMNQAIVTQTLQKVINATMINSGTSTSLKICCNKAKKCGFKSDEDNSGCLEGKQLAKAIMDIILLEKDLTKVKKLYLPLHGENWLKLCEKSKQYHRPRLGAKESIEEYMSKLENELLQIREEQALQAQQSNIVMKLFIQALVCSEEEIKFFFLKWMKFYLNALSAEVLPQIRRDYNALWSRILQLKRKLPTDIDCEGSLEQEIKENNANLDDLNQMLLQSSFGIEHFMREIAQMYIVSQYQGNKNTQLATIAAGLLVMGQPLELMDGDAAFVPLQWISDILAALAQQLKSKKHPIEPRVFVLTVLGIQSSGKSTLLNTLFGMEFYVSAGRCTRGAFMQLVRVSDKMPKDFLGYDYLLIVDTEGLRAPELSSSSTAHSRDNELATFVIGIADVTLINIFGENPSEMQDILQIVVQAFLRMKQVNIKPKCYFVHQNVGTAEEEKLITGKRVILERLDEMTKLAAEEEKSHEQFFRDVIDFDIQKNVLHVSTLWQGDPPMAPPNPGYSKKLLSLKFAILNEVRENSLKCFTLTQLNYRIKDLWAALLQENFVFSFRNTLEVSLYRELEKQFINWRWQLQTFVAEKQQEMLHLVDNSAEEENYSEQSTIAIETRFVEIMKSVEEHFNNHIQNDLIYQWKQRTELKLIDCKEGLVNETKRIIEESYKAKSVRHEIDQGIIQYKINFIKKAQALAEQMRNHCSTHEQKLAAFDSAWREWLEKLPSKDFVIKTANIWVEAQSIIFAMFNSESGYINSQLQQTGLKERHQFLIEQNHVDVSRKCWQVWKSKEPTENMLHQASVFASTVIEATTISKCQIKTDYILAPSQYLLQSVNDVKDAVATSRNDFKKTDMILTPRFETDLSMVVLNRTACVLDDIQEEFVSENEPKYILERLKGVYFDTFIKYIEGADKGLIAADLFMKELENAIHKAVFQKMGLMLTNESQCTRILNSTRYDLEMYLLEYLVNEEDFQKYLEYIMLPKNCIKKIIRLTIENCAFDESGYMMKSFQDRLVDEAVMIIYKCNQAHIGFCQSSHGNQKLESWMQHFQTEMQSLVSISGAIESLNHQEIEGDQIDFFLSQISKKMEKLQGSYLQCIKHLSKYNPDVYRGLEEACATMYNNIVEDGCFEKCPFCSALCNCTMNEHEGKHYVKYHRPEGVIGTSWKDDDKLAVEICSSLMNTDCNFRVNDIWYPYTTYGDAGEPYNTWSITFDESFQIHWKWYCVTFKDEIEKFYGKDFRPIPETWYKITKEDVLKDIKKSRNE